MNKKTKVFVSLMILIFSVFVVYIVDHKQLMSKADQQTTKMVSNLDANGYRGGGDTNFAQPVLKGPVQKNGYQVIQSKTKSLLRELSTVETLGSFRLTAESIFSAGQSYVDLNWNAVSDTMDGYVVERTNDNVNWVIPPTNYGKRVRILNVHPATGNFLAKWMNQDNGTGTPVSMNLIDVVPISTTNFINRFNRDPNGGLKDSSGNYQYDGIYFGSADGNNSEDIKRSDVINAVKAFGQTGRSLIFGHDTVMSHEHPGFNSFASELGVKLLPGIYNNSINDDRIGSNLIQFTPESVNGYLYRYPYFLDPTQTYVIKPSHTGGQFYLYNGGGRKWMSYKAPYYFPYFEPRIGAPTNIHYLDINGNRAWDNNGQRIGDDNAYLVTKNNYAIIQTGHSTGACTPDEAKVIANMIYYTSTLNTTTHGEDHTVKDSAAPDIPTEVATGATTNNVTLNIDTQDNGTDYYYRVKAKKPVEIIISDKVKTVVKSGLKGYIYLIDNNPTGTPTVTTNPSNGEVTNINLNPESGGTQASLNVNRTDADKYLHIVAVDNANNVSGVKTIRLSDYLWWKIDPTTKALKIFPHELNGSVDTSSTYVWPWHGQAAEITKAVISTGVTARGSLKNLFADLSKATAVDGLSALNTTNVTDISGMFNQCRSLTSIDVSHFDTSNVSNMSYMFNEMHKLKSLDVTNFDTGNVTDMKWMFAHMSVVPDLNLSNFNTTKVTTMTSMFGGSDKLWKLTLGASSKLSSDAGLVVPTERTAIYGTPTYYVTSNNWREVATGTEHEPKGDLKTSAQVLNESQTRSDTRTYVWDQIGKQTLTSGSSIDFGTHSGALRNQEYLSLAQTISLSDNRNARNGMNWRIEAKVSNPLTLTTDSTKKISGNPLFYQDLTSGTITNLTSVAQVIHRGVGGTGYQDLLNYSSKLKFKAIPANIPEPGQYKGQVTYTLVNIP